MTTILAVDPKSARDWFEESSTGTYPTYSGH
jgi:hypothetical protein